MCCTDKYPDILPDIASHKLKSSLCDFMHVQGFTKWKQYQHSNTAPEKEFESYKGKLRKSGTGCVTMINDHLYEGRFTPRVNGKRISKNVYAKTREECEEKLAELIKTMKAEIAEIKNA